MLRAPPRAQRGRARWSPEFRNHPPKEGEKSAELQIPTWGSLTQISPSSDLGWLEISHGFCTCCVLVHAAWLVLGVNVAAILLKAKLYNIYYPPFVERMGERRNNWFHHRFLAISQTNTGENILRTNFTSD